MEMAIQQKIREAAIACGKTQTQLGLDSKMSQVAIHKFIKRDMSLTGDNLERVALATGHKLELKKIGRRKRTNG